MKQNITEFICMFENIIDITHLNFFEFAIGTSIIVAFIVLLFKVFDII